MLRDLDVGVHRRCSEVVIIFPKLMYRVGRISEIRHRESILGFFAPAKIAVTQRLMRLHEHLRLVVLQRLHSPISYFVEQIDPRIN